MSQRRLSPDNWARVAAITTSVAIKTAIVKSFPEISGMHRDEVYVDVIDRLARMRGFQIKREAFLDHEESE